MVICFVLLIRHKQSRPKCCSGNTFYGAESCRGDLRNRESIYSGLVVARQGKNISSIPLTQNKVYKSPLLKSGLIPPEVVDQIFLVCLLLSTSNRGKNVEEILAFHKLLFREMGQLTADLRCIIKCLKENVCNNINFRSYFVRHRILKCIPNFAMGVMLGYISGPEK